MENNQWRYWQNELERIGKGVVGNPAALIDERRPSEKGPFSGYWRLLAARTKHDWPVATWTRDDNTRVVKWGPGAVRAMTTEEADEFDNSTILNATAIRKAEFEAAAAAGKWPDGKPARPMTAEEKVGIDVIPSTPASEGGNAPEGDVDDYHAQVEAKIAAAMAEAATLGAIDTQAKADAAAAIRNQILAAGKLGKARFEEEKRPWLEGSRKVDAKWSFLKAASDKAIALLDFIDGYQRREQARLQKEQREREEAERRRIAEETRKRLADEAEQRRKDAEEAGRNAPPPPTADEIAAQAEQIAAETVETVEVAKPKVQGDAFARSTSKAKRKVGKVIDYPRFIEAIRGQDDFITWLDDKANKLARAGVTLDGMRIDEQ